MQYFRTKKNNIFTKAYIFYLDVSPKLPLINPYFSNLLKLLKRRLNGYKAQGSMNLSDEALTVEEHQIAHKVFQSSILIFFYFFNYFNFNIFIFIKLLKL